MLMLMYRIAQGNVEIDDYGDKWVITTLNDYQGACLAIAAGLNAEFSEISRSQVMDDRVLTVFNDNKSALDNFKKLIDKVENAAKDWRQKQEE